MALTAKQESKFLESSLFVGCDKRQPSWAGADCNAAQFVQGRGAPRDAGTRGGRLFAVRKT